MKGRKDIDVYEQCWRLVHSRHHCKHTEFISHHTVESGAGQGDSDACWSPVVMFCRVWLAQGSGRGSSADNLHDTLWFSPCGKDNQAPPLESPMVGVGGSHEDLHQNKPLSQPKHKLLVQLLGFSEDGKTPFLRTEDVFERQSSMKTELSSGAGCAYRTCNIPGCVGEKLVQTSVPKLPRGCPKQETSCASNSTRVQVWGASQVVLVVKNSPANERDVRDAVSIPGSRRSFGGGLGNPCQYFCWRILCKEEPSGLYSP